MNRRRASALTLAVAVATISVLLTQTALAASPRAASSTNKVFHITARQWAFEPSDFVAKQGDNVTFILTSLDVRHGFGLTNYSIAVDADPGKYAKVSFIADEAGRFEILCFVYCGEPFLNSHKGHFSMNGTLMVVAAK